MKKGTLVYVLNNSTQEVYSGVFGVVEGANKELNTIDVKFANDVKTFAAADVEEANKEILIDYLLDDMVDQYNKQERATLLAWFPEKRKEVPELEEFVSVYKKHYESLEFSRLEEMHKAFLNSKYYI